MSSHVSTSRSWAASQSAGPALSTRQWLLLGRGLWWLLALAQGLILALPELGQRLPERLRLGLWWLVLIGLCCLLFELLCCLVYRLWMRSTASRSYSGYLRIRLPLPQTVRPQTAHAGAELWHSLHALFDQQGRDASRHAWLSLTMSAATDEKISFGALIGSQSETKLQEWLATLRHILGGYAPDALIDAAPDPLRQACERASDQALLACMELVPACGPEYLLRSMEETSSDLLTPLLAQLRAHSELLYCELQVTVRPHHEGMLSALGWRASAAQRLVRTMQRSPNGSLQSDKMLLERKLNASVYDVVIRAVVLANSQPIARQALRELATAFGHYSRRSGLHTQRLRPAKIFIDCPKRQDAKTPMKSSSEQLSVIKLRAAPASALPRLLLPLAVWQAPGLLSSDELAGLWHLPGAEQSTMVDWLTCRYLTAGKQALMPAESVSGELGPRIKLGHALRGDGSFVAVGPYLRDLRQILHVTAGMGGGKSRLLANIAQQLMQSGFVLIDGKGDDAGNLASTVRRLIAPEDEQRLAILDMTDTDWPVGINPLLTIDRRHPGALDQLSALLDSVFARIDPETWQQAPGMQQFLSNATRLVIETEAQPTLLHIQRILVDEAYRKQLLERASSLEMVSFWRDVFPSMGEGQRSSITALLRRFERILGSELVRAFVSQQQATFRFREAFEQRLIVICPIPHVSYGALASTVAMLIFMAIMRAAFERPGTAATRSDYALIVDEFQVLVEHGATQDVATALTQLRSLGMPTVYAHQTLSQIGELRDLLMVNAENRVIIRTQEPDASTYARHYAAAGITAADVSNQLPNEHQYARFAVAGSPMPLCSIRPLPWPESEGHQKPTPDARSPIPDPTDWRRIVPDDAQANEAQQRYDRQLAALCHRPYSADLAQALAQCSPDDWALMIQRWPIIAQAQRHYILTHPGSIAERFERQRWLSRLAFARPRVLVEAEYRRLRGQLSVREQKKVKNGKS